MTIQIEADAPNEEYSELEREFLDAADEHLVAWLHERSARHYMIGLGLIAAALLAGFLLVLGQWSGDLLLERSAGLGILGVLLIVLMASFLRAPSAQKPLSAADWLQLWRTDRHGPGHVLAFDPMTGKLVRPHAPSLEALAEFIWQGRIDATILRSHFHLLPPPGALDDAIGLDEAIGILQLIGVDIATYASRSIGLPAKTTFKAWKRKSAAAGFGKR